MTRRTLDRRTMLGLTAGVGALALTATACSRSAGPSPDASEGRGSMRFAWWGNDTRAELTREALAAFEEQHGAISVSPESGGFDGYFDKLATQVAGRNAPDAFQLNEWNLREYGDRGALLDLSQHGFTTDGWSAGSNTGGEVDGQVYGGTAGVGLQAVLLNPAVFDAAGIDLPDDTTWTWDDYRDLGAALTAASPDGTYGLAHQGGDQITSGYYFGQVGSGLFEDDRLVLEVDAAAQWYAMWAGMLAAGATPPPSVVLEDGTSDPGQSLLGQGRLGMQIMPANLLGDFETASGAELQLRRIPTVTGTPADLGMWYRPSMLFCVWSGAADPDTSTALVDFLLNDPVAAEILLADRGVPANEEIRDGVVDLVGDAETRLFAYMDACAPDLVDAPTPPPAGASVYQSLVGLQNQDVLFEEISPEQAAQNLVDGLTDALA